MLLFVLIFATLFLVVLLCVGLGMAYLETVQRKQVRQMLHTAEPSTVRTGAALVRAQSEESGFEKRLARAPLFSGLLELLEQSRSGWTIGKFLLMTATASGAAGLLGFRLGFFSSPIVCALLFGGVAGMLPLLIASRKRAKTMAAFEQQFPEALDFISRSMRAGHGFNISIEMLAADAAEPLASAFRRVAHEVQLGSALNVALSKMVEMVPLLDVRFFVSAVLLQQETGGNLSEILGKLAYVIRETFRLRGQVRAVSAHGRITGLILLLMPVAVVLILLAISPGYLNDMIQDSTGKKLIWAAIAGQVLAWFVIRKIVNIRV